MSMHFERLTQDGAPTVAQPGDRVVYDARNGTLLVFREAGEVCFVTTGAPDPQPRLFVGREWTPGMTKGAAELYARLGGLNGVVKVIEGSFHTLHTYEIVA